MVITPGIGIEFMVLQQAVGGAVDLIRTGFQERDNSAAVGVPIRRRSVSRNYSYLGNGIGRGIISNQVVLRLVQVSAFQRVVIGLGAIAVDRRNVIVVGIALDRIVSRHAGRVRVDGSGLKERERGEVPAIQRDIGDFTGGESVSQRGIRCVEDRSSIRSEERRVGKE